MVEMGTEEQQQMMVGFSNNDATHIAKGKRTKRLRLLSPCGAAAAAAVITSSCSSASGGDNGSFSSTTVTHDESIDLEEEDMANCLILLAQGGGHNKQQGDEVRGGGGDGKKTEKGNRRFAEITTTATNTNNNNTKVGLYIYECKTCNRTFPSFQALGGHRASHKKPKIMAEEKKQSPPPPPPSSSQPQPVTNHDEFKEAGEPRGPTISLQLVNHGQRAFHGNKAKVHECSICGSEFTSGQALGGHMRRHRTTAANTVTAVADDGGVRHRNILELDLNLPAPPEDDIRESKFQFPATQKSMVLSAAPALVGCHY